MRGVRLLARGCVVDVCDAHVGLRSWVAGFAIADQQSLIELLGGNLIAWCFSKVDDGMIEQLPIGAVTMITPSAAGRN